MDDQRTNRASGKRIGRAIRGFFGTLLLGALLFGVPFAIFGIYHAIRIADISGKYPDKSGVPITSMGEFINITWAGITIGVVGAFLPAVFVGTSRLMQKYPTR